MRIGGSLAAGLQRSSQHTWTKLQPSTSMADSHGDVEPCSSNRASQFDEGCSLLLELSESDPLFEEKKKLLLENGFTINERLYFNTSLFSDWTDTTLNLLLRRARIISLNEVEVYFGEMDVDSPPEFYSPRNELEALNLILSCTDTALNSSTFDKKVLQDLRRATVHRIHKLGRRNQPKARVVDCPCEKENSLLQWSQNLGSKSTIRIAHVEGAGRGAVAVDDLNVGDVALDIPLSIIISEEAVHDSDMFHTLGQTEGMSAETMLLLWSMRERHNSNSKYKNYFDTLPERFNTVEFSSQITWVGKEELMRQMVFSFSKLCSCHFVTGLSFGLYAILALEGTLVVEEILQAKEHLRTQYDELFPALCDSCPDIFPPEMFTWDHYVWACELWYSNSMKIMFPDGKLHTCLIPVAGFLNHSVYPHITHYGKVDPETNSLKFPLSRPCKAGDECYLGYGNLSSSHLLTFYGFLPQGDNPYDVIPLDFGDEDSSTTSENTTHMVRGTWFSRNHGIFHYGLPTPLLDHIRKSLNPYADSMKPLQGNLEDEIRVLESISSIFEPMMEALGDPAVDDSENADWDVKLALQFKDLQRRIVSSVVNSCSIGRDLVIHELCKCLEEDITG